MHGYSEACTGGTIQMDGELDLRRYRLNDIAARLEAILSQAQTAIDRRYGGGAQKNADGASAPCRSGSVGQMDDMLDRIEALVDRSGSVVATLGAL